MENSIYILHIKTHIREWDESNKSNISMLLLKKQRKSKFVQKQIVCIGIVIQLQFRAHHYVGLSVGLDPYFKRTKTKTKNIHP